VHSENLRKGLGCLREGGCLRARDDRLDSLAPAPHFRSVVDQWAIQRVRMICGCCGVRGRFEIAAQRFKAGTDSRDVTRGALRTGRIAM